MEIVKYVLQKDKRAICCNFIIKSGTEIEILSTMNGRHAFIKIGNECHKIRLRTKSIKKELT